MASFEQFVLKVKPALDMFLRAPNREHLERLRYELLQFDFRQMKVFHSQILAPLVLKLEELNGVNQDLMTGILDCVRIVMSKLYLEDIQELRTLLVIVLKQIRESGAIATRPNISEELKLVSVQCIAEALRRSSSDVLEEFYKQESAMLLGQILLSLVEFIEKEIYRKLVIASIVCLMTIFYVHDEAEFTDVVLRNQVADTIFIFLPKIVTVLLKTSLADEKLGETLKATAIKALGRVLCVIFDHSGDVVVKHCYDKNEFKNMFIEASQLKNDSSEFDTYATTNKSSQEQIASRLKRMQSSGRSKEWFKDTSVKLRIVYTQTNILRSHDSLRVRTEYARMCCSLIERCGHNLSGNFILLLENVISMSQDEDKNISQLCAQTISRLQQDNAIESIFDEYADTLFDEHLAKLPRIINRCADAEQYAELIFLKGFLKNLSASKMKSLFLVPKNLEMLCRCLLSAVDMKLCRNFLAEEYAVREVVETDFTECAKLSWRQYKHLNSERCIKLVEDICVILGKTKGLSRLMYDLLLELLDQNSEAMNEILLIMLWVGAGGENRSNSTNMNLVEILTEEILNDKHWHLALRPDASWRLKVDKPTNWFVDNTPGLYESAVEIRTQDVDSDDEKDADTVSRSQRVTILDAEFNVLHTCLALDVLGHCATNFGVRFSSYIFRCLHKVLLKVASSNTMVYQAANFCLVSIQKALKLASISELIEAHTDYLSYHLNTILKRSPESHAAVDILTVLLQLSTRRALPHLENIFQTIYNECSKSQQSENINAFLRVFNAFLKHVARWQMSSDVEVCSVPMQVEDTQEADLLQNWLDILERTSAFVEDESVNMENDTNAKSTTNTADDVEMKDEVAADDLKPQLPRHIQMVKDITTQVLKFVGFVDQTHQILALECLIQAVPLLHDYEDELLPLVHLTWSPLVERFRNNDAVVLNRCFTLLNVLATHAKEFILKRSLDDVIPNLKDFLQKSAKNSVMETITAHTQEYKLQVILLEHFANLIESLQIDGKHLNDIAEIVSLYLAKEQPKELQELAIQFYLRFRLYDGPLAYMIVLKKAHISNYKDNAEKVLTNFRISGSSSSSM
ncbi:uncharacterized protein LOC126760036 [Bactrocera neohumeralis]|uniref:uncharacterized protein LOC126760036 n=1 Tax=Bactrocera neohumeralis TaxID=98809 RepID=UPI0021656C3F|nr:uncharacterized protein LOC126760036 [Bactrocera neohumeralis]